MKPCPHCAELIQDSAVFCRFCAREIPHGGRIRREADSPSRTSQLLRLGELLFGAVVVAVVGFIALQMLRGRVETEGLARAVNGEAEMVEPVLVKPPPPPPPLVQVVLDSVFSLAAGEHFDTTFTVTDPRDCLVAGRVRGVSGGDRSLDVYVLDEMGDVEWHNGIAPSSLYRSGRTAEAFLHVQLPAKGRYTILISNRFSLLTGKTVQVRELTLTCDDVAARSEYERLYGAR